MTGSKNEAPRGKRSSPAGGWLAGLVLGAASGFLVAELGVLGTAFLAASIALIAWKGPRLLAIGGLLTGFGALWTVLFVRITATCGPDAFLPDEGCATEDLTQWIAGSGAAFVTGLLLSSFVLWRSRQRRS